jgi:hypothetical protein
MRFDGRDKGMELVSEEELSPEKKQEIENIIKKYDEKHRVLDLYKEPILTWKNNYKNIHFYQVNLRKFITGDEYKEVNEELLDKSCFLQPAKFILFRKKEDIGNLLKNIVSENNYEEESS